MNLLNYLLNNINLVPIIMYELCQQYKALLVYKPLYQYSARGIYGSYFFYYNRDLFIYLFIYYQTRALIGRVLALFAFMFLASSTPTQFMEI